VEKENIIAVVRYAWYLGVCVWLLYTTVTTKILLQSTGFIYSSDHITRTESSVVRGLNSTILPQNTIH